MEDEEVIVKRWIDFDAQQDYKPQFNYTDPDYKQQIIVFAKQQGFSATNKIPLSIWRQLRNQSHFKLARVLDSLGLVDFNATQNNTIHNNTASGSEQNVINTATKNHNARVRNTHTLTPQSNNVVQCGCGGHYINRSGDKKEHEKTAKHRKWVT
jgi:hypothetical protein